MATEDMRGRARITIEIEVNDALMEIVRQAISTMPEMVSGMRKGMHERRGQMGERQEGA